MTIEQALEAAIDDEFKARATYRAVIDRFGEVRPFVNIVESEGRHISALQEQFRRLGLEVPEDRWDGRVAAPASVGEACRNAVDLEIANEQLYVDLIAAASADPKVLEVFSRLRSASVDRHLPAFRRCAERGGRGRGARDGD